MFCAKTDWGADDMSDFGILRNELKLGVVSSVTANMITVNLSYAGESSASYIEGHRYGRGEVGEIVLIEGQQVIALGRLTEVRLPERERGEVDVDRGSGFNVHAIGLVRVLGSVSFENLKVEAGLTDYPRLGDRVFSASSEFIAAIPQLVSLDPDDDGDGALINLGEITGDVGCRISVKAEELFGRHCAILGSTGGGKSWTVAKVIEECSKFGNSKVILVDATSEYRSLPTDYTLHYHLGSPIKVNESSSEFRIPPTDFEESDFVAMFDPSGKVQGPKLREAIKSLRLAALSPTEFPNGYIPKVNMPKDLYRNESPPVL